MSISISEWLEHVGLEQFAAAFRANDVDLRALPHLSDGDLKELGVRSATGVSC